jgi:hypothetical protein
VEASKALRSPSKNQKKLSCTDEAIEKTLKKLSCTDEAIKAAEFL